MLGSKGAQHVGLDEVREGERRWVSLDELQDRGELAEPSYRRIGPSEKPGPQRGGRQPQIAAGLGDRIGGLGAWILLRQWFLQPVLCIKFASLPP